MPIYEYVCKDCDKKFEALVYGSAKAECPACHGKKLEQQLSVFASRSGPAREARSSPADFGDGGCGSCGDPRGPGSCKLD
jgi:putative FmdB family regulatory protein